MYACTGLAFSLNKHLNMYSIHTWLSSLAKCSKRLKNIRNEYWSWQMNHIWYGISKGRNEWHNKIERTLHS